jgi:zinc transport system ATP-binding protein
MSATANNPAVEIEGVSFSYGRETVLENVSLMLPDHLLLGIIGPNGAGKTTLIKLITGLLRPDKGEIRVLGKPPGAAGGLVGYVPQRTAFDPAFPATVLEVVRMGRLSRERIGRRFDDSDDAASLAALKQAGLSGLERRRIGELSAGQRQRVLLARALAASPRLLILDEPLSGVDIGLEEGFYDLLLGLRRSMAIILISHDVGVVARAVDRIACLNRRLYYHDDKAEALKSLDKVYGCPVDIIAHGVPHRVFGEHGHA